MSIYLYHLVQTPATLAKLIALASPPESAFSWRGGDPR